jgi:hypothetical protein
VLGLAAVAFGGTDHVSELIARMIDNKRSPDARQRAHKALVKIGAPAVAPLIDNLKDANHEVRVDVVNALGEIKDPRAVEPLIEALKDTAHVSAVLVALGKIQDHRAVEPLIAALEDKDPYVRLDAVWALGEINDSKAIAPLAAALRDRDIRVQGKAGYALSRINDPRASSALQNRRRELAEVARNYKSYIKKGNADLEDVMIDVLRFYGDEEMALIYLNCGNSKLEDAAEEWAKAHRRRVERTWYGEKARTIQWGSER